MKEKLKSFLNKHEEKVVPLTIQAAEAYFDASISGKQEDYQKAADLELKINKIYANKEEFEELKQIKNSAAINDLLLKRQLDILYLEYLGKQIDEALIEEIIKLQTKTENTYATHRVKINGKSYTDNQIDEILKESTDHHELESFYIASKEIGQIVEPDVLNLVELRNAGARQLGFDNYHTMSLKLSEQEPEQLDTLFDDLDRLTRNSFGKVKKEIDQYLSKKMQINESELMPWHYQNRFFQEAPEIYNTNLDEYYKNKNIQKITQDYYESIGLPIKDLISNSDLYEKENKYQHAYCINIDRTGDVRVVCNIKDNANWMGTMLHEFGHAVYDKFIDPDLPWLLRSHAHIFTTEAIAMFFGRLSSNLDWIENFVNANIENKQPKSELIKKNLQLNLLIFCRWVQVMYRFEKQMYHNPKQDLNKLWWDLVEEYQQLKRPKDRDNPDWASKIHVALYPAYYHNYMLGELLASQLQEYIQKQNSNYFTSKRIGEFFKNKVFNPGAKYKWDELVRFATDENLTPKYFAKHISFK